MPLIRGTPLILIFEALSRAVIGGALLHMFDLGISGFIEKVETRFGRWVANILLLLIVLTIAAICLNTLYTMIVLPLIEALHAVLVTQTFSFSSYWDILKNITILILAGVLAFNFIKSYKPKKQREEERELIKKFDSAIEDIKNALNDANVSDVETPSMTTPNESAS
jgi:membrane protein implicated in regulation of membrane protease activity